MNVVVVVVAGAQMVGNGVAFGGDFVVRQGRKQLGGQRERRRHVRSDSSKVGSVEGGCLERKSTVGEGGRRRVAMK